MSSAIAGAAADGSVAVGGRKAPADKYDERRRALGDSALRTLGELGYARASLREIANNSEFSHGVVHYYFEDKHDLIVYCVREYKSVCVRRYDGVIADSTTPEELVGGFADKLIETLRDEAAMHRLWYDVRTQSMFDDRLRAVAVEIDGWLEEMVGRVVGRYAELAGTVPALPASVLYGIVDGLFQQALLGVTQGREGVLEELHALVHALLPTMVTPA
ncbi:TetR/AcrR family transcriptional regulator [Nocardioides stalactiti]|uniref:TetR/AcrR family transcriptional regulator n=1 Tax=Nocardioides stalactiti TaxID=2755356 RepID=UPI001603E24D|nr:TetR/AcrR family transcriptional regulator [Nocardioides stalactiti]